MGKKSRATIITPVTILKQLLELDKHVSKIDVHRMDKEGLYAYVSHILSDETIEKLNTFNEIHINKTIVETILKSTRPLPYSFAKPLSVKLRRLNADAGTIEIINQYIQHSRNSDAWNKYKTWVLLLIVILLCLLIYVISV